MNLHLNYIQWRDSGTAAAEHSTPALAQSLHGQPSPVAGTQGGSVALVSQDHLTRLDELQIIFRTVPEGFLLLPVKGQPHRNFIFFILDFSALRFRGDHQIIETPTPDLSRVALGQ